MRIRRRRRVLSGLFVWGWLAAGTALAQPLPPPPVPPGNPITESKRVLGKILFWDEQLSSDDTVSCGTCHILGRAGSDPRSGRNPGIDALFQTPDDALGSPGVAHMNTSGEYISDPIFGFEPQVTRRNAQHVVNSAYSNQAMFWDGRATGQFINPETGQISLNAGAALESQALVPILSSVEMGNDGRTWDDVRGKLASVRPLRHARRVPPDVSAVLANADSYGTLFAAAFGDPGITADRIARSIATYERTLISGQTPFDAFIGGNPNALTPGQQAGFNTFQTTARCNVCHTPPVFSNQTFRNIGLRPVVEDLGRQEVTGVFGDRGRFKVPGLRNVGLKNRFMHNGQLATIGDVVTFYVTPGQQFPDNRDPIIPTINVPPQARPALIDFLTNALTDPRVRNEQFPFDRPLLRSEAQACSADLNGDRQVDLDDLSRLLAHFGAADDAAYREGDIDADGDVDLADLAAMLASFGATCP